jgi:acetolactate synthase-1/2/3 large subunit
MLGMHGTYEANLAMHDCDLMINIGARFDDRITGRLDAFSPGSKKIHVDIDRSSINKNVHVDIPIVGDAGHVLEDMIKVWKAGVHQPDRKALAAWWSQIDEWRSVDCLKYEPRKDVIMPQYALQRLHALTKDRNPFFTTEVGQHQMWAAQFIGFEDPNHWMTSGGLGTMGYGMPAAIGVQLAHPDALVVDVAGEASILMNIQEFSTAVQHELPIKIFILNNEYMGMVRQWQDINYEGRYAHSYSESLPDFVKLAEAMHGVGLRATKPEEVDGVIEEMMAINRPVIVDCQVAKLENCFPMVPSGAAHNEIMLNAKDAGLERSDDLALV